MAEQIQNQNGGCEEQKPKKKGCGKSIAKIGIGIVLGAIGAYEAMTKGALTKALWNKGKELFNKSSKNEGMVAIGETDIIIPQAPRREGGHFNNRPQYNNSKH